MHNAAEGWLAVLPEHADKEGKISLLFLREDGSVHHRFEPVSLAELVTQVGPVPFGPTVPESA